MEKNDKTKEGKAKVNIHKNHRSRMHKKFDDTGFDGWSKYEIMEYMLYNVFSQKDTNPIAHALFDYSVQSIVRLFDNVQDFRMAENIPDVGNSTVRFLRSLHEFMLYYQREKLREQPMQLNRDNFYEILGCINLSDENEEVVMICMDKHMRVKSVVNITDQSDTDYASIKIDKLIKTAAQNAASNVALVHTHPSGADRASREDILMTREVRRLLETIHVNLIDHYILSGNKLISIGQTMRKMERTLE